MRFFTLPVKDECVEFFVPVETAIEELYEARDELLDVVRDRPVLSSLVEF